MRFFLGFVALSALALSGCSPSYYDVAKRPGFDDAYSRADAVFIGIPKETPLLEASVADCSPPCQGSSSLGAHTDVVVTKQVKGQVPDTVRVYFNFDKESDYSVVEHLNKSKNYLFVGSYNGDIVRVKEAGLPFLSSIK